MCVCTLQNCVLLGSQPMPDHHQLNPPNLHLATFHHDKVKLQLYPRFSSQREVVFQCQSCSSMTELSPAYFNGISVATAHFRVICIKANVFQNSSSYNDAFLQPITTC